MSDFSNENSRLIKQLMLDGVPIWGYINFIISNKKLTVYKPTIRFTIHDFIYLFKLLLLPLLSNKYKVICIPNRQELVDFVEHHFKGDKVIIFLRSENKRGNSFLIEAMRMLLRLLSSAALNKEVSILLKERIERKELEKAVKQFRGDLKFNKVLSWFLKGKEVYYTNCIIPKVEKYMGLHDSYEIQHGVIYKGHPDYSDLPSSTVKRGVLAWNDYWKNKLVVDCLYPGLVIASDFESSEYDEKSINSGVLVLTTVSDNFSQEIISKYNRSDVIIRRHPRDYFDYIGSGFSGVINDDVKIGHYDKLICHDTTLIRTLVTHKVMFFYLLLPDEEIQEVKSRLLDKYGACWSQDYEILSTFNE